MAVLCDWCDFNGLIWFQKQKEKCEVVVTGQIKCDKAVKSLKIRVGNSILLPLLATLICLFALLGWMTFWMIFQPLFSYKMIHKYVTFFVHNVLVDFYGFSCPKVSIARFTLVVFQMIIAPVFSCIFIVSEWSTELVLEKNRFVVWSHFW